jgi:hypothetical protein
VSPLSVLTGCLEAAFAAAHLIDSPQLQGSSCLGWVMVPEVQTVVTSYAERFMEQVGAQVRCEAVCCINWTVEMCVGWVSCYATHSYGGVVGYSCIASTW